MIQAASPPLQLKWDELAGAVRGKHISVNRKDGSVIAGVASRVEASALIVVSANQKSEISIPREVISNLRITKSHVRGRIIGATVGAVLGLVGGAALVLRGGDEGFIFPNPTPHPNRAEQAAGYGLMLGLPVGGYVLGRSVDRYEVTIVISPQ